MLSCPQTKWVESNALVIWFPPTSWMVCFGLVFDIKIVYTNTRYINGGRFGVWLSDKWCVYGGWPAEWHGGERVMVSSICGGMVWHWVCYIYYGTALARGHVPSLLCPCHSYQADALAVTYGWPFENITMQWWYCVTVWCNFLSWLF